MYSFKLGDNIYDWISCIDKNKVYFGPFPNQLMIDRLIDEKFDLVVNLTMYNENIYNENEKEEDKIMYRIPKNKYIAYPIKDNDIPECPISYCSLILKLKQYYEENKKIYIHCRGGHGRSGMVSTSLFISLKPDKNIKSVIEDINSSHINRTILRNKWKKKSAPFNYTQYSFILKIHKNIYININNKHYGWLVFNDKLEYKDKSYYNIYDFFMNTSCDKEEKDSFIESYFLNKINSNKDIECKLYLTYLRNIVLTDCSTTQFCDLYSKKLHSIRDSYFLKNY